MHIIAADWSGDPTKRAAAHANVAARSITLLKGAGTLASLVQQAQKLGGPVIVGVDAPLGVPESLAQALTVADFRELLRTVATSTTFFTPITKASAWKPTQPFFRVPAGKGARNAFEARAQALGVTLYRKVDRAAGARSPFIVSGIPGTVGSATIALWQELIALVDDPTLRLWPFDGADVQALALPGRVVVAEIYPRAAYATALDDAPPLRARMSLAKTDPALRAAAIQQLRNAAWVQAHGVTFAPDVLEAAVVNEDAFDAVVSAAALLRVALTHEPWSGALHLPAIEGGILGTGGLDFSLPERKWPPSTSSKKKASKKSASTSTQAQPPPPSKKASSTQTYPCPIPGCTHVFVGGRGGWDAHVGSRGTHPAWHPDVHDAEQRKALFRKEFPSFFL
jgi:hypothetical protein